MVLALAAYVHASVSAAEHEFEPGFAAVLLFVDLVTVWLLSPI
ncbi:hypothetical protein [Halomicrobium urmianum]|nr:hypothetical protein [Halomicrobium urmianum]